MANLDERSGRGTQGDVRATSEVKRARRAWAQRQTNHPLMNEFRKR